MLQEKGGTSIRGALGAMYREEVIDQDAIKIGYSKQK
jgi:hypothetical protein